MTGLDAAVEAAARVYADDQALARGQMRYGDTSWACVRAEYRRKVMPAIEAAAPLIERAAKAEALRDAADAWGGPFVMRWLRNRADAMEADQ